jgi:hypothetical protein
VQLPVEPANACNAQSSDSPIIATEYVLPICHAPASLMLRMAAPLPCWSSNSLATRKMSGSEITERLAACCYFFQRCNRARAIVPVAISRSWFATHVVANPSVTKPATFTNGALGNVISTAKLPSICCTIL